MFKLVNGEPVEMTADEVAEFEASRVPPPPTLDDYRRAVDSHVDAVAQSRGYNNAVALASYFNSTVPDWAAEAGAFVPWRDAVWSQVFDALATWQGGGEAPESPAALVASLPAIEWPS